MSGDGDDPAAIVAAIEARAQRFETPCGDGTMVWRMWGQGPPVALAHGAQGAWSHWIRNVDALAQHFTVIAADLPGQGDSALPSTPDHPGIARAIADGLSAIVGAGTPVDLVGFSFGGVMFSYTAALFPAVARRVILVGCGGLGTPHGHISIGRVSGLIGEARRAAIKANLLGLMLHHPETVDEIAMHLLIANARKARLVPSELVVPDKLAKVLPEIRGPVDAIWGEFDRPHPVPAAQEAVIRRFHPTTDFRVIADAGHWAMYERPEAFNAALIAMLKAGLRPR